MDSSFYGVLRQDLAMFLNVTENDIQFRLSSIARRLLTSYLIIQVNYSTQDAADAGAALVNSGISTLNTQLASQGIPAVTLIGAAQVQSSSSGSSTQTYIIIGAVGGGIIILGLLFSGSQMQNTPIKYEKSSQAFIKIPPHLQVRPRNPPH